MATYTNYNDKLRETINVGYSDRVTLQPVKFYNDKNEYRGTFSGTLEVTDSTISGGTITNVTMTDSILSNVSIYSEEYGKIDLGKIQEELEATRQDVDRCIESVDTCNSRIDELEKKSGGVSLSTVVLSIDNLCSEVSLVKGDIVDLQEADQELREADQELDEKITAEAKVRNDEDKSLSSLINTEVTNRVIAVAEARKDLSGYVDSTAIRIENKISDDIERYKHYSRNIINATAYPYQSKEFAINEIVLSNIQQGHFYDQKTGSIVATINKVDGDKMDIQTDLNIDRSIGILVGAGVKYHLSAGSSTPAITEGYTLTLNSDLSSIELAKPGFIYNEMSCAALGRRVEGFIENAKFTDHFISGVVTVTESGTELSDFCCTGLVFDQAHTLCMLNENDGIELISNDGHFEFNLNYCDTKYTEFTVGPENIICALVYHVKNDQPVNDIRYDGNTISAINVCFEGTKYWLTRDTGFRASNIEGHDYWVLSCAITDDVCCTLDLNDERYTYNYIAKRLTEEQREDPEYQLTMKLSDYNKHLSDDLTGDVSVILNRPESFGPGEYVLNHIDGTDIWKFEDGDRSLIFDKDAKLIAIQNSPDPAISATVEEDTETVRTHTITSVLPSGMHFNTVDASRPTATVREPEKKYIVTVNSVQKEIEKYSRTFERGKFDRTNCIEIVIPEIKDSDMAREAIYSIKANSAVDELVPVYFVNADKKEYCHTVIPTNKYSYLYAIEATKDSFIINDLAENEGEWKFDWLKDKLFGLSNEVSSISTDIYAKLDEHDDKIDDIYKQLSGGLTYRDTLSLDVEQTTPDHPISTFTGLFFHNVWQKYFDPCKSSHEEVLSIKLRSGFYYLAQNHNTSQVCCIEGLNIEHGDLVIIKKNCEISSITSADVNIYDAQDTDVFHLSADNIAYGNNYLGGRLSADILSAQEISTNFAYIDNIELSAIQLSGEVNRLCTEISNDIVDKYNAIDARLIAEQQNIESISTDIYKNVDGALPERGLSGKVEFLLSSDRSSMCYGRTLMSVDASAYMSETKQWFVLSDLLSVNYGRADGFLKQGFMFRLSAEQMLYPMHKAISEKAISSVIFEANDYFIVNKDTFVSNLTSADVDIIYDAGGEAKQISADLSALRLSVEQTSAYVDRLELSVSGISTIVDNLSTDLSNAITALSDYAHNELELSVSQVSGEVNRLCTEISDSIKFLSNDLLSGDQTYTGTNTFKGITQFYNDVDVVDGNMSVAGDVDATGKLTAHGISSYEDIAIVGDSSNVAFTEDNIKKGDLSYEYPDRSGKFALTQDVADLSTSLSTTAKLSVEELQKQIVSNDTDITYLSSELSDYHNTLSGIDRLGHMKGDIVTDNLMLTDMKSIQEVGEKHDKYYLQVLSGTLVLVQI